MEGIANKYLQQLQQRVAVNGIQLQLPRELAQELAGSCRKQGGARSLRRLVQEKVEGPLAVYLLHSGRKPAKIKAKLESGEVVFQG